MSGVASLRARRPLSLHPSHRIDGDVANAQLLGLIARKGAQGIEEWRSGGRGRLDLSGADLRTEGRALRGALLGGAILNDANLAGANLEGAHLQGALMTGTNLKGAVLTGADLSEAFLTGADLSDTNLDGATIVSSSCQGACFDRASLRRVSAEKATLNDARFNETSLVRASLSEVSLRGSLLEDVDLSGAYLRGATLQSARLNRVDLAGADLSGVVMGNTTLVAVSMRTCVGLETVEHARPSAISTTTLAASAGDIPPLFLRRIGLEEWEVVSAGLYSPELSPNDVTDIAYRVVQLRSDPALSFYSCFISHSVEDKAFARRLYDSLEERGIRCWLDERQILPGDDIRDAITEGIRVWDKLILCASEASLRSWWVERELKTAFGKEEKLSKAAGRGVKAVIPLDLDRYLHKWEGGWAEELRSRKALDFSDPAMFEQQLERLVTALRADPFARVPPPTPKLGT